MFCFVVVLSNPFPEQLSMLGPELCLDQKTVQVHMNTKAGGRRLFWLAVSPCPARPGVPCAVPSSGLGLRTQLRGGSAHPGAAGQWCWDPLAGACRGQQLTRAPHSLQRRQLGLTAVDSGVLFTLPNQDESYILN